VNYAVEMVSDVVMYVSTFIKIGSGVQRFFGVGYRQRDTRRAR
jgi:hypothetical protein